jgi:hypothetical protein
MAADNSYPPVFQRRQDGNAAVPNGVSLDIETGGALKIAGVDRTAALATAPAGVASGYKIARGELTLDGANPSSVVTGLATVVAATVTLKKATTPGDDPIAFTVDYGGGVTAGQLDVYAWKTDGADPTLIASTNSTAIVSWIAIGT